MSELDQLPKLEWDFQTFWSFKLTPIKFRFLNFRLDFGEHETSQLGVRTEIHPKKGNHLNVRKFETRNFDFETLRLNTQTIALNLQGIQL
jgi:hypothetical protein